MTFEQSIGMVLALLVMGVGLIGTIVPGLPGTPLVLAAAIGHRLYFGPSGASNAIMGILVILTVLAMALDYLASVLGAKTLGATWRGLVGALVGGIVGLFFSLPGILLGPFIGALAFELAGGRDLPEAAKAGAGAMIGLLLGAAGKLACCIAMIGLFVANVLSRSGTLPEAVAWL